MAPEACYRPGPSENDIVKINYIPKQETKIKVH